MTNIEKQFIPEHLNKHLSKMNDDYLYHLSLSKNDADMFSDIKYVIVGGSNDRMTNFAHQVAQSFGFDST